MMTQRSILFVGLEPPQPTNGSNVVLFRHLQRLRTEGWEVAVLTKPSVPVPGDWTFYSIERGRRPWPIYRQNSWFLLWLRGLAVAWSRRSLVPKRPDVVLTVAEGLPWPYLAVRLAAAWKVPLAVFVHDAAQIWQPEGGRRKAFFWEARRIAAQADQVWFVSKALQAEWGIFPIRGKQSVLLPIPSTARTQPVRWRLTAKGGPIIMSLGGLKGFQAVQFELLARLLEPLGGEMHIVGGAWVEAPFEPLAKRPNVVRRGFFPTAGEAMDHLASQATAAIVSYPFDDSLWARTSFPSRLLDYASTGIPIVIIAPLTSPLGEWAQSRGWMAFVPSEDEGAITAVLRELTQPDAWERHAAQTRQLRDTELSAERIHQQFTRELPVEPGR